MTTMWGEVFSMKDPGMTPVPVLPLLEVPVLSCRQKWMGCCSLLQLISQVFEASLSFR